MSSLYSILSRLRADSVRTGAYRSADVSDTTKRIRGKRGELIRAYVRESEEKREGEVLGQLLRSKELGDPEPPLIYPPPKPRK